MRLLVAAALVAVARPRAAAQRRATRVDFIADAKLFYRVVACGGHASRCRRPRRADRRQALRRDGEALRAASRRSTSTPAQAFFAALRPATCRRRSSIRSAAATSLARS